MGEIGRDAFRTLHSVRALAEREKSRLLNEVIAVRGLMPLLMKPRDRQQWTRAEKVLLARHVRRLSRLSPYMVVFALPGGMILLPALAWWLDRRRGRDQTEGMPGSGN